VTNALLRELGAWSMLGLGDAPCDSAWAKVSGSLGNQSLSYGVGPPSSQSLFIFSRLLSEQQEQGQLL